MTMEQHEIVRDLLAQMRVALANEQQLPQAYVDCRVVNLSTLLATKVDAQSEPFDWAALSDLRRVGSY